MRKLSGRDQAKEVALELLATAEAFLFVAVNGGKRGFSIHAAEEKGLMLLGAIEDVKLCLHKSMQPMRKRKPKP